MQKKSVVVLLEDEKRKYPCLQNLGGCVDWTMTLCRCPTESEILSVKNAERFTFETFGLLTQDQKLDDFIISRDGVIVMINSFDSLEVSKRLEQLNLLHLSGQPSKNQKKKPLLVIFPANTGEKKIKETESIFSDHPRFECQVTTETEYMDIFGHKKSPKQWFYDAIFFSKDENGKEEKEEKKEKKENEKNSRDMLILNMIMQFHDKTLPMEIWDHYGRLRIVDYALTTFGKEEAYNPTGWLCSSWKAYKTSLGHGELWHYSLTRFWILFLDSLRRRPENVTLSFAEIYDKTPALHQGKLFEKYYSKELLFSEKARREWVPPDLLTI